MEVLDQTTETEMNLNETVYNRLFQNVQEEDITNENDENDEALDIFGNIIEDMFIQLIVTNTTRENIDKVATSLEKIIKTVELLVTSKVTEDCVGEVSFLFSGLQEIVQPFTTDYRRKKK